jgi:hypothetical protein
MLTAKEVCAWLNKMIGFDRLTTIRLHFTHPPTVVGGRSGIGESFSWWMVSSWGKVSSWGLVSSEYPPVRKLSSGARCLSYTLLGVDEVFDAKFTISKLLG